MTRLSAAQTEAVTAIRDGRVLSEAEQRDLQARHEIERDRPREAMPCGIPYDPRPGTF